MPSPLAHAAASGFHDAHLYDTHRPSYPPAAVRGLLDRLLGGAGDGADAGAGSGAGAAAPLLIVEIGAGTGKFTEALVAATSSSSSSSSAAQIVAVEPHAQMRAELAAKQLPRVAVVDGHGADLGAVASASADAVVVAQAFHWFANLEALAEIHRVLKPGAGVGVIWNIEDYNKPPAWPAAAAWEQALNDLVCALPRDGSPRFRDAQWQQAFAAAAQPDPAAGRPAALFAPLADDRVAWTVALAPDALWPRLLTLSQIANLPEEPEGPEDPEDAAALPPLTSRAAVRRRLDAVLARDDVVRAPDGTITLHAHTYFAWAHKV